MVYLVNKATTYMYLNIFDTSILLKYVLLYSYDVSITVNTLSHYLYNNAV